MTAITEAGGMILPAVPAFYYQPKTVEDVVDTVVARALQQLGAPRTSCPSGRPTPKTDGL